MSIFIKKPRSYFVVFVNLIFIAFMWMAIDWAFDLRDKAILKKGAEYGYSLAMSEVNSMLEDRLNDPSDDCLYRVTFSDTVTYNFRLKTGLK